MGYNVYVRSRNQDSRIKTRTTTKGRIQTAVVGRDDDASIHVTTDPTMGTTRLSMVDENGNEFWCSGRFARTIQRVLNKHYGND